MASFILVFSPVRFRQERKLRADSVGFSMYFHLVYSAQSFRDMSGRILTLNVFCEATDRIVTMDNEFVENSTSPSSAFVACPLHMSVWLPLDKWHIGVVWVMGGY